MTVKVLGVGEDLLEEEWLSPKEVTLLVNFQYRATTSRWNRFLEHMVQSMVRILTNANVGAKTDEVENGHQNWREYFWEATYDTYDKYDTVEVSETITGHYSTAKAGSDDESVGYRRGLNGIFVYTVYSNSK